MNIKLLISSIVIMIVCLLVIITVNNKLIQKDKRDFSATKKSNDDSSITESIEFETINFKYENKVLKFKSVECNEKYVTDKTYECSSKKYDYKLKVNIIDGDLKTVSNSIMTEYWDNKNIDKKYLTTDILTTEKSETYILLNAHQINDNEKIVLKNNNILYEIDKNKIMNISFSYMIEKLNDTFFTDVANSIEIE